MRKDENYRLKTQQVPESLFSLAAETGIKVGKSALTTVAIADRQAIASRKVLTEAQSNTLLNWIKTTLHDYPGLSNSGVRERYIQHYYNQNLKHQVPPHADFQRVIRSLKKDGSI
ncbi:hypothetical protein IFT84_17735 [Rhizobium sp. CFBP 8762]|uniref:hypothetical protein n=1 Tax=Rhizobium sp. CFBP 8762 TaxID=2775279 RepID=UPI00177B41D7|nr:hypothetical protein [Rhizobium sp. CFBP 8762]MBD8556353.1 hypothetical protein [Rhizobium sp. CFBP 8762]